eukprot:2957252-Prymnesium_polylepis.1
MATQCANRALWSRAPPGAAQSAAPFETLLFFGFGLALAFHVHLQLRPPRRPARNSQPTAVQGPVLCSVQ